MQVSFTENKLNVSGKFDNFSLRPPLPDELILKIFWELTPKELCVASLVCKRWKQLAEDDFLWYRLFTPKSNIIEIEEEEDQEINPYCTFNFNWMDNVNKFLKPLMDRLSEIENLDKVLSAKMQFKKEIETIKKDYPEYIINTFNGGILEIASLPIISFNKLEQPTEKSRKKYNRLIANIIQNCTAPIIKGKFKFNDMPFFIFRTHVIKNLEKQVEFDMLCFREFYGSYNTYINWQVVTLIGFDKNFKGKRIHHIQRFPHYVSNSKGPVYGISRYGEVMHPFNYLEALIKGHRIPVMENLSEDSTLVARFGPKVHQIENHEIIGESFLA